MTASVCAGCGKTVTSRYLWDVCSECAERVPLVVGMMYFSCRPPLVRTRLMLLPGARFEVDGDGCATGR